MSLKLTCLDTQSGCGAMQLVIEELIRGVGYVALRLVTVGRYRGGEDSRLAEGAIGFALVVVVAYVVYAAAA